MALFQQLTAFKGQVVPPLVAPPPPEHAPSAHAAAVDIKNLHLMIGLPGRAGEQPTCQLIATRFGLTPPAHSLVHIAPPVAEPGERPTRRDPKV
jgi:hypothetical protein